MNETITQIVHQIANAQRILAFCHVAPDGDAIGSLLALGYALEKIERQMTLVCSDPVPESFAHLAGWNQITQTPYPQDERFDLIISLDCSDLQRLGDAYDPDRLSGIPIINIDHHVTNVSFGDINWIDTGAAATAQMLYTLINALDIPLDATIAACLLNGILTDTLGFRTANTTADTMDVAVQLIRAGASLAELTDSVFHHRPMSVIKMWSAAMDDMHLQGRILWSQITQEMRQRVGYKENGDSGLVSFFCAIDEADIAVVFDELDDGKINVSMRAVPGYQVSQVALALGGGGHPQAAGCTIPGPLAQARDKVLSMLRQTWDEQSRLKQAAG